MNTTFEFMDFVTDGEKMADFFTMSKNDFLMSYSYLDEREYDMTFDKVAEFVNENRNAVMPTRNEIVLYLERNGYPSYDDENKQLVEMFVLPDNYDRRFQYWEAVKNDYELCEFERWQHLEDVIKHDISFDDFMKINNILYTNDVEILDLN